MKRFLLLFFVLIIGQLAFASFNEDTFKFYSSDNIELSINEVKSLYPDYSIILFSKFNKDKKYYLKNSVFKSKKVLLLNDTKRTFQNYEIYPISSRGEIKALVTIYGKKNVRLKHFAGDEFEIVVK